MAGCIIMSQTECHPHSHECPVSQWAVWQGGEVLQKSKKNQKRDINKADATLNLIYSVPGLKMQSEKVCPFKMGWVKEEQQHYPGRMLLAMVLERKENAEGGRET